jgi:hypothetical protein
VPTASTAPSRQRSRRARRVSEESSPEVASSRGPAGRLPGRLPCPRPAPRDHNAAHHAGRVPGGQRGNDSDSSSAWHTTPTPALRRSHSGTQASLSPHSPKRLDTEGSHESATAGPRDSSPRSGGSATTGATPSKRCRALHDASHSPHLLQGETGDPALSNASQPQRGAQQGPLLLGEPQGWRKFVRTECVPRAGLEGVCAGQRPVSVTTTTSSEWGSRPLQN